MVVLLSSTETSPFIRVEEDKYEAPEEARYLTTSSDSFSAKCLPKNTTQILEFLHRCKNSSKGFNSDVGIENPHSSKLTDKESASEYLNRMIKKSYAELNPPTALFPEFADLFKELDRIEIISKPTLP